MGNVLQGRSLKPVDSEQGIDKGASLTNHHIVDSGQNGACHDATASPTKPSPTTEATSTQLSDEPLQTSMDLVTNSLIRYKNSLKEKNRRIDELASELNKLASVLQQHLLECETWKKDPPPIAKHLSKYSVIASRSSHDYDDSGSITPLHSQISPLPTFGTGDTLHAFNKRLGVSAEPAIETVEIKYYDKTAKSRQEIRNALRNNEYLKNFNAVQLQEMVSCMYPHKVAEGCYIIKEGEDGHHLYVAEDGEFQIWQGGKYLNTIGPGNCFGELALICNTKRTASVKAVTDARIWVLERKVFQVIMMKTGLKEMEARVNFLSSVPLLKNLERSHLHRIGDVLEAQYHPAGECIIRQGELADSFFIIQSGEVRVTMRVSATDGTQDEVEIRKMTKGEYFGEKALLGEGRRTANCYAVSPDGVALLCLYRKDFLELMGNFENLEHKEYLDQAHFEKGLAKMDSDAVKNDATVTLDRHAMRIEESVDRLLSEKEKAKSKKLVREFEVSANLKLGDLERVAVIGQGGFGSVELVRPKNDTTISFALKRMKKVHIVETKQQDHVHSEKRIMMAVDHVSICKLFKTYKDNKFVYMLMEFCPGGELWTVLRDRRSFDDKLTRFSLACVIEAFDYLHNLGIIYRDLKPENMLLTTNGYIKLCDFGFAKRLGSQRKTWTFCGTPEYVAPEVILNKGHDFAADYWSLGILTCELLIGTPPFQASEPIKIYMKALRGIDAYDLSHHKNISAKAYQFIRKLCRTNPTERLGTGRLGIQEMRSHKYFQGFDWDRVRNCTFQSPFKPKVSGPLDFSNFDQFPATVDSPPDEMSGWDKDF